MSFANFLQKLIARQGQVGCAKRRPDRVGCRCVDAAGSRIVPSIPVIHRIIVIRNLDHMKFAERTRDRWKHIIGITHHSDVGRILQPVHNLAIRLRSIRTPSQHDPSNLHRRKSLHLIHETLRVEHRHGPGNCDQRQAGTWTDAFCFHSQQGTLDSIDIDFFLCLAQLKSELAFRNSVGEPKLGEDDPE